jgi:hypothetical protein
MLVTVWMPHSTSGSKSSMSKTTPVAPRWGGRVPKSKITRIYQDDARGFHDTELINDVAYTLYVRCHSMLKVEQARQGRATCPVCKATVVHRARRGDSLSCEGCGWIGSWDDYRGSFDGLHLIAPGLLPFCREYVRRLPSAKTARAKMYWIDWLIHRFHWEGTALPGQAGATCLIEGRDHDVNAFLSALSARSREPPGIGDPSQYWSAEEMAQIGKWRKASDRRRRKRERAREANRADAEDA